MDETLKGLAIDQRTDMLVTANDGFEMSLEIVGENVVINGVTKKVIFTKKENANGDTKHISSKIGDIGIGDVVEYQSRNWLIVSFPIDNSVYLKADVRQCNSTFPIKANKTRVLMGNDDKGKPLYKDVYSVDKMVPCVAEIGVTSNNTNAQLIIPKNTIYITVQYQTTETFAENYEFTMYGNKYKIVENDPTKLVNDKGVIKIIAERA